jgi:hypothetical protein
MFLAAFVPSSVVRADGSPLWTIRARRIVAKIYVPDSDGIHSREGTGFFVGFTAQTLYLVTAAHVIWPAGPPRIDEKVKLNTSLSGCDARVPALADSAQAVVPTVTDPTQDSVPAAVDTAQAGTTEELDMALVRIDLANLPGDVRTRCQDVLSHLDQFPRHIIDPDRDRMPENAPAWLIGPGVVFKGSDARPVAFKQYLGNTMQFTGQFTPGDSGSPIFSAKGYILGMAIKDTGEAAKFSAILTKLDKDWAVPTNLAGWYSNLVFGEHRGKPLSIDGAPAMPLELPHPAPLGKVALKLRVDDKQVVTDIVDVVGTDMSCNVTLSWWLARHKRAGVYVTLSLAALTGVVFAMAKTSQSSFEQSPSRTSYDHVGLFNAITIGTGGAGVVSLGATVTGYFLSDTTSITCREGRR